MIFEVVRNQDELIITHKERGELIFNMVTFDFKLNPTMKKYDDLRKYFINYGFDNYWSQSYSLNYNVKGEAKDIFIKYFRFLKDIVSSGYYKYTKSNLGNILKDFYSKKTYQEKQKYKFDGKKFENLSEIAKSFLDILGSDLNFDVNYENYTLFQNLKFRKDVRKVLKEFNIIIDKDLIEIKSQDEKYLNEIVIILRDENLINYFPSYIEEGKHSLSLFWNAYQEFQELKEFNYDIKSVITNIINYYSVYENLDFKEAVRYLKDYGSMNTQMKVKHFKKYPRFLRSNHDIIVAEYRSYKKEYSEELFLSKIKSEFEFKSKNFLVVNPKSIQDLKDEGEQLSHCVGSYIDRIIDGKTNILFMRKVENKSLITLEVRNNTIIQAKGYGNRMPTKEEEELIRTYANEKELLVRY